MNQELTPKQIRAIEIAVAKAMAYPVVGDDIKWGAFVEPVPHYGDHRIGWEAWGSVEKWMGGHFTDEHKRDYAAVIHGRHASTDYLQGIYRVMTAPLLDRCIAFLKALGVDVDAVLREAQE